MVENFTAMMIEGLKMPPQKLLWMIPVVAFILTASYIDSRELRIPNKLNYTMIILRLMAAAFYPLEGSHFLGLLIGGALIFIPAMIVYKPMGGDIKFAAALGFWIGDIQIFITMATAVVMFIVYGVFIKKLERKESVAFAPFISIAFVITSLIGCALQYL